jgi:thiol-disulfide isomerase/thioredoxin
MIQRLIFVGVISAFFIVGCEEQSPKSKTTVGPDVDLIAPPLDGTDTNGNRFNLADQRGKVVVVDFWATWCKPCVGMIPEEKSLMDRLKGRPLAWIAVSADFEKSKLTDFMTKEKITWPNIYDGAPGPLIQAWRVNAFPTLFVIDAKGVIRYRFEGVPGFQLDRAVIKLLDEADGK